MTSGPSISASRHASRAVCALAVALAAGGVLWPGATSAQDAEAGTEIAPAPSLSGIATLDSDALFLESAFGQRVQRELERDRAALGSENRRIEQELIAEERDLTERRPTLPADEFADLASAFDDKVQAIRTEQDQKARRLQEQLDRERQRFLSVVGPVLTDLLRARDAAILIDSDAVLVSVPGIDITEEAIAAIDARLSDGRTEGLTAPAAPPAPTPPPEDAE